MEKIGHRYMIQYFYLKGLSPTNIKAELDSTLGESAPSFSTIKYWVAEFKQGCTSCQDEHRSGRLNEVTTAEMVNKNSVVRMFQSSVWRCFTAIEPIFHVNS